MQAAILERLGFGVEEADDGLDATVPHWRRNDVTREADLVEEVARIWGLEHLPATMPGAAPRRRRAPHRRAAPAAPGLEDALTGAGLLGGARLELRRARPADRLGLPEGDPRRAPVRLTNPMSEEQSVLRTILLGGLLDAVRRNRAHGAEDVRLWEHGAVYLAREGALGANGGEARRSTGASPVSTDCRLRSSTSPRSLTGRLRPPTWRDPEPRGRTSTPPRACSAR